MSVRPAITHEITPTGSATNMQWQPRDSSLPKRAKVSDTDLAYGASNPQPLIGLDNGRDSPTIPGHPPLRKWFGFTQTNPAPRDSSFHERSSSTPLPFTTTHTGGDFTNPRAPTPVPVRRGHSESASKSKRSLKTIEENSKDKLPTLKYSRSFSSIFNALANVGPAPEAFPKSLALNINKDLPKPPAVPPKADVDGERPSLRLDTNYPENVLYMKSTGPSKSSTPVTAPPLTRGRKSSKSPTRLRLLRHAASANNLSATTSAPPPAVPVVPTITPTSNISSPEKWVEKIPDPRNNTNMPEACNGARTHLAGPARSRKQSDEEDLTEFQALLDEDNGNWKMPRGLRPMEAAICIIEEEKESLYRQAAGQAEQFEILDARDVSILTRELRALNERCEYLRKNKKSLRFNRRKMQSRIISYLKSDNLQFSKESLLRQEEALVELDKSIDDWMLKLDQAENRRLRVRQKLLEHFAAAMTLQPGTKPRKNLEQQQQQQHPVTPPGSPVKSQQQQSIATTEVKPGRPSTAPSERSNAESIKIYADGQMLTLFSEVERTVSRVCEAC